ncbi:hypothetical protein, partial [Aeromonas hydrophila]|uniref:hypothetical protein n=1 Tax=Aeromonas hydrophila TaxID=644 RepID=UPI001C40756A
HRKQALKTACTGYGKSERHHHRKQARKTARTGYGKSGRHHHRKQALKTTRTRYGKADAIITAPGTENGLHTIRKKRTPPSSTAADIKNGTARCRLCQPSGASSASLG